MRGALRRRKVGRSARLAVIDAARGVALMAMALYHATWDLGFLQLTPVNYALTAAGKDAARAIAASFLVLVGVSLVLAQGQTLGWAPYLRRLAQVAGAALAITLATVFLFPGSYIFFGILHCIAAASVLALPFLRLPPALAALAAGLVFALPLVAVQPVFDAPLLAFLGLGTRLPVTNDYVPLFPWFGFVLAGTVLTRIRLPWLRRALGGWTPRARGGRAFAWAGRHSLAIYLLHQPLLLGAANLLLLATGPNPQAEAQPFLAGYAAQCREAGGTADRCDSAGRCLVARLRERDLWIAASRDGLTPDQRETALRLSSACYGEGGP